MKARKINKRINRRISRRSRNAYVIFTREPVPGKTKTRLMPYYTADQCAELHKCFIRDIAREMKGSDFDIVVAYTGGDPVFLREVFGRKAAFIGQRGDGLGEKMENAIADVLAMGYERVVLTGTDIPELEAETIETAFAMLSASDVVIGPTSDGGYYLIGMSSIHHEAFDVKLYGVSSVFEETVSSMKEAGLCVSIVDEYSDIDTKEDLAGFRRRAREDAVLRRSFSGRFASENLRLSIIIPIYNEEETIERLTAQLRPVKDDAEMIFVDGGSTDNTLEILGDEFTVIRSGRGRGHQMDTGAEASSGDVLFFLHCDSVLPEDFMAQILKVMATHEWGCFGIKWQSRNFFMLTNRIISNHRAAFRGIPFCDQGIFIDRELFFDMGMFPEYMLMEDYEFSRRMKKAGHRPGLARNRMISSTRRYGKGTIGILKTEFQMWNLRRLYRHGADHAELNDMYRDIR